MEPEPTRSRDQRGRGLPADLAGSLAPEIRDALDHPVRRQILRSLEHSEQPRTASEIAAAAPSRLGVSVVSYHARVLEGCGVWSSNDQRAGHELARAYVSTIEDEQIGAILKATEQLDRDLADAKSGPRPLAGIPSPEQRDDEGGGDRRP